MNEISLLGVNNSIFLHRKDIKYNNPSFFHPVHFYVIIHCEIFFYSSCSLSVLQAVVKMFLVQF